MTFTHPIAVIESRRKLFRGSLSLRILALSLVVLGFCVFAWGLKYKLSLYDPPHSVSHSMPEAKLLPGPKRTAVAAVDWRRSEHALPPLALATVAFAFFVLMGARLWPGFSGRFSGLPAPGRTLQCFGIGALSTRPPPFSL